MSGNVLAPLTGEVKASADPIVTDIETWGLDARPRSFAIGVAYDGVRKLRFYERDALRRFLTQDASTRGRQVYAHNGGGYDYLSIFGDGTPAGMLEFFGSGNVILNGSRFIEARLESGNNVRKFRDSLNLLPASVEEIGKKLGYPKGVTPEKFKRGDRSAGLEDSDFEYAMRDCEVVWRALMEIKKITGELRATIPSTAMAVFRRSCLTEPVWIRRELDEHFHLGFHGGRTEAYRIGDVPQPNFYYDVNSLYPYAMIAGNFPNPAKLHQRRYVSPTTLAQMLADQTLEGCATVEVWHPPTYIGYLPYRDVNASDRLLFPVGKFTGTWCFPELRYAISRGIKVLRCELVSYSAGMPSPFTSYVSRFFELKKTAEGFEREVYKLLMNGLYGKFAEWHSKRELYARSYSEEKRAELAAQFGDVLWQPLGKAREDGYYVFEEERLTSHTIFCWASYITAYARVRNAQLQDLIRDNGHRVFYTDTDSFLAETLLSSDASPESIRSLIGEELGQLKLESYQMRRIYGNKDYERTDFDDEGKIKRRLKGVPKNAEQINPSVYRYQSIVKLRQAIRRGIEAGSPVTIAKELTRKYTKRQVLPNGDTLPIEVR